MKFSVNLSDFMLGVNTVCKAISNRTTLPILENLYMELNKDKITLRGNDLELGIEYQQVVNVSDSSGPTGVLLKANTLSNILSKLNSEQLILN